MNSIPWTKRRWVKISLLVVLLSLITFWLIETPHGVEGKIHAIGYAVCHQIESHTLEIGGKLLPLCARCTGMYLGALVTLFYLANGKKQAGSPSKARIIVLAALFLLFVVDGTNSMLSTFFRIDPLYPPANLIRLATGLLMGMILVNLILPLWNQTLWKQSDPQPAFKSWKQLIMMLICLTAVGVLVWLDISLLYYPVAIFSTGTILLILSMVYSLLWCIILNKENSLEKFKDGLTFYFLGVICALVQIGLMDLIRFSLVGSWSGFQI